MKLSIIIPVYNSEKILPTLLNSIYKKISKKIKKFEIILVNDCSHDQSWKIIKKFSLKEKYIKGINLKYNYGQHYAIFTGLKYAKGDQIICMDDDMQHDPNYINDIYLQLTNEHDVCYVRYLGRKHNLIKIFISWLNNIVSSYLMSKSPKIYTSSFKGFNKIIKKKIIKNPPKFVFLDFWVIKYGKKINIINVFHKKRLLGDTNYKLRELITLWSNMIFLIDTKKKNLKSLIIIILKLFFKTFLKEYIDYKDKRAIIIDSKTFR